MMTAKAAISARPLTACPSAVPAITPGRAAAMNATAWRQQTRLSRAWVRLPMTAPAVTTTSEAVVAWWTLWPRM